MVFFFFFKQKAAYEIRISDWSSDVCSSDLRYAAGALQFRQAIRLIDPFARDVDRGRAAHVDRKPRQPLTKVALNDLALRKVGIPFFLGIDRSLLAQRRKGDLEIGRA